MFHDLPWNELKIQHLSNARFFLKFHHLVVEPCTVRESNITKSYDILYYFILIENLLFYTILF